MNSEGKHMETHNRESCLHKKQEWAFVLKVSSDLLVLLKY